MNKKYLLLIPVLALALVACDPNVTTSTTSGGGNTQTSTTTTSLGTTSTGTTSSEPPAPVLTVADVLGALQNANPLAVKGPYSNVITLDSTGETVQALNRSIQTLVSSDRYVSIETDDQTGAELYYFDYFRNAETGAVEARYLDATTNETKVRELVSGETGEPIAFVSEYYNPFVLVEEDMGSVINGQVVFNFDELAGRNVFSILSGGYDAVATSMTVTVDDNLDVVSAVLETEAAKGNVETAEGELVPATQTISFAFDFVSADEIAADDVAPRTRTADHDAMADMIDALKEGNFTVSAAQTTVGSDEEPAEDNLIVTKEGIEMNGAGGVMVTPEGLVQYELSTGDAVLGTTTPDADSSISDYLPGFTVLPEMFDLVGENKYQLTPGTEAFALLNDPSATAGMYSDIVPDHGTVYWTLNSETSLTIEYTYTFSFEIFGQVYSIQYDVKVDVTDIGTTVFPRTVEELVPYTPQTSWNDIDGMVEGLADYGITPDIFPFWLPEGGEWIEDFAGYFGPNIYTSYTGEDDAVLAELVAVLTEAGWVSGGTNDYGEAVYNYTLDDGTVLEIGIMAEGGWLTIYIYEPEAPYVANDADEWVRNAFADSTNSFTISYEINQTITTGALDENNTPYIPDGNQPTTSSFNGSWAFSGTAIKQEWVEDGITWYYTEDTAAGTVSAWEEVNGVWTEEVLGNGTLLNVNFAYPYRMLSEVGTQNIFEATEIANTYNVINDTALAYLVDMTNFFDSSQYDSITATAVLDEEAGTLTFNVDLGGDWWYLDSSYTTIGWVEESFTLTISNVGTTTVDTSILTPAA